MGRLLTLAAIALLLAACDPAVTAEGSNPPDTPTAAATAAPVTPGATLRWAIREPASIVPVEATADADLVVVDTLFDSLTAIAADGTVQPRAAVRWSPSKDGRRWRFVLRPGARYHDGSRVRAQDFRRAWSMSVSKGMTGGHLQDVAGYRQVRAGRAARLSGVRALDARTLEVRLDRPDMAFPAAVAHPTLGPLPASAVKGRSGYATNPIGNGPYRMSEPWSRGHFIRVEREDEWRNGPRDRSEERVREVLFRIIDPDAAYVAFQQGRIDVAQLPAGALQQALRTYGPAEGSRGPGVVATATPSLYFIGLRTDRPPWDDVEVRRALSRAIDRRALVDEQRDLGLDPARRIVPPVVPARGAVACTTCLHLPSLAAAAFDRAGVRELTLTIDAGGGHERVADRLRTDLAAVGVDLAVRELPFDEYLVRLESGDADMYRFGWQAPGPVPASMLEPIVRSGTPVERGDGANYGGYASPRVDSLLDRARRADTASQRHVLWARAEQQALDDQAIVPLFTFRHRTVIADSVEGLVLTSWGTATPERASVMTEPAVVP